MKVLINNTALRNNGDVLLVESLARALRMRGHTVVIATSYPERAKQNFPHLETCREAFGEKLRIFRFRYLVDLSSIALFLLNKKYREADIVIGAPGGYLNSFYGFLWKLNIYKWSKIFRKKTAIFSQSVGPLTERDKGNIFLGSKYIDKLLVRDSASLEWSRSAGIEHKRILLTDDAAFLSVPHRSSNSAASKKVIFSVRAWMHESRSIDSYIEMIKSLVRMTALSGYEVEFISTCQGISGYIDDSLLAHKIAGQLANENIIVKVIADYTNLSDLKLFVEGAKFVVGTRLHMCLLAVLVGVPAFNISYEKKGIECYTSLNMPEFSIDYNEPVELAELRFLNFMKRLDQVRIHVECVAREKNRFANESLDIFLREIGC